MALKTADRIPWHVLDACQSKEALHDAICEIATRTISRIHSDEHYPLSTLWQLKGAEEDETTKTSAAEEGK